MAEDRTIKGTDLPFKNVSFFPKGVGTMEMNFTASKVADETKYAVEKTGHWSIAQNYNASRPRDEAIFRVIMQKFIRNFPDNTLRKALVHRELGDMTMGTYEEPPEAGKELWYKMSEGLKMLEETTKPDQEIKMKATASIRPQQWAPFFLDPGQRAQFVDLIRFKLEMSKIDGLGIFFSHLLLAGKPCAFLDNPYLNLAAKGSEQTDAGSKVAKEVFKANPSAPGIMKAAAVAAGQFHDNLKNIQIYNVAKTNSAWDPEKKIADHEYRQISDVSTSEKMKEYYQACFFEKKSDNKYTTPKGISRDECLACLWDNLFTCVEQMTTMKLPTNSMRYDSLATTQSTYVGVEHISRKEDLLILMNPDDYTDLKRGWTGRTGPASTRAPIAFDGTINGVEVFPFRGYLPGHALVLTKYIINIVPFLQELRNWQHHQTLVDQTILHSWFWYGILTEFCAAYFVPSKFVGSSFFYTKYERHINAA